METVRHWERGLGQVAQTRSTPACGIEVWQCDYVCVSKEEGTSGTDTLHTSVGVWVVLVCVGLGWVEKGGVGRRTNACMHIYCLMKPVSGIKRLYVYLSNQVGFKGW